jgi:hypothetical protein
MGLETRLKPQVRFFYIFYLLILTYLYVERLHTPTPPKAPGRVETVVAAPAAPAPALPAPEPPAPTRLRRDQGSRPTCLDPSEVFFYLYLFSYYTNDIFTGTDTLPTSYNDASTHMSAPTCTEARDGTRLEPHYDATTTQNRPKRRVWAISKFSFFLPCFIYINYHF